MRSFKRDKENLHYKGWSDEKILDDEFPIYLEWIVNNTDPKIQNPLGNRDAAEEKYRLVDSLAGNRFCPELGKRYIPILEAIKLREQNPIDLTVVKKRKPVTDYSPEDIDGMPEQKLRELVNELIAMGAMSEEWRKKNVFQLPKRIKKAIAS